MREFVPLLTPLRGTPVLSPIISFDCETYGEKNEFQMAVVSTPEADILFENPSELLDYLTQKKYWNHNIYATNLQFDAMSAFQAVAGDSKMPPGWSIFDNGSKVIWIRKIVREKIAANGAKHYQYCSLLDSMNLFPAGVAKMGDILQKVAKQTGNPYYNQPKLHKPEWLGSKRYHTLSKEEKRELITYCAQDARTTRIFMEWFCGDIVKLGGEPKMTAASTTLDIFRRKYMREANICIPQPSWDCLLESRLSYYGGRTENYVLGTTKNVWDYDVTAMYPSAMAEITYPYPSPEHFRKWISPPESCLQHEGFSYVDITVPYMDIPPLPWRSGPKLLFPYGKLTGVWTNLTLRYAQSLGCQIEEIHWCYFNKKTFNPFVNFVKDLFEKRMQYAKAGMATEEVVKLFLNGLYGKFAQNFLTEEQAIKLGVLPKRGGGTLKTLEEATMEEIEFTGENYPNYLAKGFVVDKAIPKLKAFMNPILSSYTTARAQIKLHEFNLRAIKEGANVLYNDTDSLYCDKRLSFAVPDKQLGLLQEGKEYASLLIVGPKTKRLITKEGKVINTAKGVPESSFVKKCAKHDETMCGDCPWEEMRQVEVKPRDLLFASLEDNVFKTPRYIKFLKYKEAFARGLVPNQLQLISKDFDPFEFPKRRILGEPTLSDLLKRQYQTVPWEVENNQIIGEENA